MKHSLRWAVLVAAVLSLGILFSPAMAQAPRRPAGGPNVALLDVSYIFKNHARFKRMMEDMKADVERAEQQVEKEKEEMKNSAEKLQEFNKGTPKLQQLEEELAKRQADLQVRVQLQKNQFLQQEATIYHNVYQEILQATEYYCKQNSIDMVLQVQRRPGRRQSAREHSERALQAGGLVSKELGHHAGHFAGIESDGDRPAGGAARATAGCPVQQVTCARRFAREPATDGRPDGERCSFTLSRMTGISGCTLHESSKR